MKHTFNINKKASFYLNQETNYHTFSQYLHFLIGHADEITKSHSGGLKVIFPPYSTENRNEVEVAIYGYDSLTLSSTEILSGKEKDVKKAMIDLFEKERKAILLEK